MNLNFNKNTKFTPITEFYLPMVYVLDTTLLIQIIQTL